MRKSPASLKDLTGLRFDRLVVVLKWGTDKWGQAKWICECDCGEYVVTRGYLLRKKRSRSCGCLQRELAKIRARTHGMSKTNLYLVWGAMINRCYNKKTINYERYGKRGITVCDEWRNSFVKFHEWLIANDYRKGLQIDRKNNNAEYSPLNCRVVTALINNNNTRRSRKWIVFNKVFLSARVAGVFWGVDRKTIWNWCLGDKRNNTPPKPNCSAARIYGDIC